MIIYYNEMISTYFLLLPPLFTVDEDDDESDGEDKEKSRKRCATQEETERVNSVLSGLGDVLEQVKEVSEASSRISSPSITFNCQVLA